jgi:hypothetical protein
MTAQLGGGRQVTVDELPDPPEAVVSASNRHGISQGGVLEASILSASTVITPATATELLDSIWSFGPRH